MPDRANSTNPPVFLAQAELLTGIQQLNGRTAEIQRDLNTFLGSRGSGVRSAAEQLVEHLISFLDEVEGDPDFEDNGDAEEEPDEEPILGSTDHVNQERAWPARYYGPEMTAEPENDNSDSEPSLGSVATSENITQGAWASGTSDDREDEHDGAEPDEDDEPALGSFDRLLNQEHAWMQRRVHGALFVWDQEVDHAE